MPLARSVLALLIMLTVFGACTDHATEDPRLREPVAVFDARALERILERAAELEGTPAARRALSARETIRGCRVAGFRSTADRADEIGFACADGAGDVFAFADARRGEADGVLLLPVGDTGRLEVTFDVDDVGTIVAHGYLRPPEDSALDLLVPGDDGPHAPVLRAADALVYARLRPEGGLRLARLLPEGGQADRMFALKGRLLEGALLRGTLELAFLPAGEGDDVPLPIGALHHRGATPLTAALEEALAQLEATWPIVRSARAFSDVGGATYEGACFENLPLLPGLAPCWVVTDDALVVGWQAAALDRALGPAGVASPPGPAAMASPALTIDLARIARDDRARDSSAIQTLHPGDLYASLTVDLFPAAGGVRFEARLVGVTR